MILSKDFFKKIFFSEVFLFALVILVMILKLGGLFQDGNLPGWDTSSHFVAFSKMAESYLPRGEISGYMTEWFGGFPLFQFYGPLFFVLTSFLWFLTFKTVSLFFIFRFAIFLILLAIVFAFWYFLKTFFNREIAKFGIITSLFFVFYPKAYAAGGIGAGAVIYGGLIPAVTGLVFLIFWLSFIEKLRQNPDSLFYFIGSVFLLFFLILTHTLSFISGLIVAFVFLIYYWREKLFLKKFLLVLFLGILLSSFWLIPFIQNLDITSSSTMGISVVNVFKDPLIALFPFNLRLLFSFETFPYFKFWALFLFVFTISGIYLLIRQRNYFLPLLFGIFFIFIVRDYLSLMFPQLSLHYYRFANFLFIVSLALGTYAIAYFFNSLENENKKIIKILFYILFPLLLIQAILLFDIGTNEFSPYLEELYDYKDPLIWKDEGFSYTKEVDFLINNVVKKLDDVFRIFPEIPSEEAFFFLGSPHYFTAKIPLVAGKSVITGLYAESAPLTPFIMPLIDVLTDGRNITWADNKLKALKLFYKQDFENHLERLKNFGVNYVIAYEPSFVKKLNSSPSSEFVGRTEHFFLFRLKEAKPFIYYPAYKPVLYFNHDNKISFRDISLVFFSGTSTMNVSLVDGGRKWSSNPELLEKEFLDNFSLLIVSGSKLSDKELKDLIAFNKPLIILNAPFALKEIYASSPLVHFIDYFKIIKEGKYRPYYNWPLGWQELFSLVEKYTLPLDNSSLDKIIIDKQTEKEIRFKAKGPVIINSGFSPYWRKVDCISDNSCLVYQVSPSQILVFSSGETVLYYESDNVKKIAIFVSLLVFVGLCFYLIARLFYFYLKKNR